jgi:hypothetical protein
MFNKGVRWIDKYVGCRPIETRRLARDRIAAAKERPTLHEKIRSRLFPLRLSALWAEQ